MHVQKTRVMTGSIRRLLRRNAHSHVTNLLVKLRPADVCSIMLDLSDRHQNSVFSLLRQHDRSLAAETLKAFGPERGLDLLADLSTEDITEVLQE